MTAPRLFVLTATENDGAVVLRRGPTNQVATLFWGRGDDSIRMGQWLKGRIYEHRSDLSPDGQHMIYFAYKGGHPGGYTVLSRAPWLRALLYRPQGHTWHGGGAFTAEGRVFLNGAEPERNLPDGLRPAATDALPHSTDGFHMGDLFATSMQRRGWGRGEAGRYDLTMWRDLEGGCKVEMRVAQGRKNRGLISMAYALLTPDQTRQDMPSWTWAEKWGDGVHFAEEGALWFACVSRDGGLTNLRRIQDFADLTYMALKAPYEGISR